MNSLLQRLSLITSSFYITGVLVCHYMCTYYLPVDVFLFYFHETSYQQ